MTESFTELFEESIKDTEMRSGEVVLGKVIHVDNETVIVSAGLKSEAEIPLWQFKDMRGAHNVNVGDEVEVEIETVEDGYGRTRLSREKACRARAWEQIEAAYNDQTVIEGVLTSRVKGGFSVMIENVRGFLPGSLYGYRLSRDEDFELETEPLEFKVIKLDRARNNVVVSRKAVLEKELEAERKALLASIETGQIIEGTVKNLTDYGAFINLGGIDGLLHITDIAWRRVKHPSEVLTVGERISVKILKWDRERSRISLGLKQLTEDPWTNIERRYKIGDRLFGMVRSITDYGAFVEIEEGIKGLVHVSEMDWTSRNVYPSQVVSVGEEIEIMVLSIDPERHRISLGMKQCVPNPWVEFAVNHKKGERIVGQIKSLTDFGIFVSLENGIDGLVHVNDITWSGDGEERIRDYKTGEKLEVVILAIDPERERISLSIKQIEEDPFMAYADAHMRGSVVDSRISGITDKGIIVQLAENVYGSIRNVDLARNRYRVAKSNMEIGEEVKSKITNIDRKNRKIALSIKALENEEFEKFASSPNSPARTLGEKLREKFFSSSN